MKTKKQRFRLQFISGVDKDDGDHIEPTCHIILEHYSEDDAGVIYLTSECESVVDFEEQMNLIIDDLEAIYVKARKRFAREAQERDIWDSRAKNKSRKRK